MVTTKLNLSMTEPQVRQIYAKQGDTGRVLDISLDQTPEGGTLRILRPDGVEVTSEAKSTVSPTITDGMATFDSLEEAEVTELKIALSPKQDLNGQPSPYPAGGGANKWDEEWEVGLISASDGENTPNSNYCRTKNYIAITPSQTYYFKNTPTPIYLRRYDSSKGFIGYGQIVGNGVWKVPSDTYYLRFCWDGNTYNHDIALNYPSSIMTYAPYSNICPITGHDEVRVYDDPVYGKTIKWNQLIQNGNFADTSKWGTWGGTITVSGNVATVTTPGQWNQLSQVFDWTYGHIMLARASVKKFGESGNVSVKVVNDFAYSNQQFAKGIATNDVWTDVVFCGTYTKTPSDSTAQVRFGVQEYRPSNSNNGFQIKNVGVFDLTEMFGEGNEPTIEEFEALFPKDYYPYNTGEETTVSAVNGDPNRQYTTSLGQTVYGGTLDMVSGVLTVTHGNIASYNGETLPSTWISDRDVYASGTTPTTGAQVVYELATPLTYTLTAQQIKTLVGTNNVWASSGDIVSIKFTYGGLLSELPSDATSIVGKCYCDVEQNGVSSMPFTLNVKKNERAT